MPQTDKFSYVIQTAIYEPDKLNLKEIKKNSIILLEELKKTTRNSSLDIYVMVGETTFIPLSKFGTMSENMQKDLIQFCKKMESLFVLFYHPSKGLWHANFRDMSNNLDFTAYGTFQKFKPGVWMSYSGGEYESGIIVDGNGGMKMACLNESVIIKMVVK